jgi:hypothetical protein
MTMPKNRESTGALVEVDIAKENMSTEKGLVLSLILYLKLQLSKTSFYSG